MGDYHTTYKRAEGESTQWEDAQRRLGNMAPAEEVWKPEAWAPTAARPAGAALIDGGRDELSDLEGEFDDDRFLEEYRLKRLAEMRASASAAEAGTRVATVGRADYVQRVTRASEAGWVVALLFRDSAQGCAEAGAALNALAASPAGAGVTFVRVPADDVTPGIPDAALPTLLAYSGGACVAKLTGAAALGGVRATAEGMAAALARAAPGCLAGGRQPRGGSGSDSE